MICLDNTDTLEGGAATDAVVDYTVHGLVGTTFTVLADGQLSDTDPSVLYTAGAAISIVSVTFVNTHSSAVAVNLYLDSADGGNPRRLIPKDLSLGIGYSMHFDGQRCTVLDASGQVLTIPITVSDTAYGVGWNGDTGVAPSKNAVYDQMESRAPKATPTFTGQATIPTIDLTGGQIAFPSTAAPSAGANTLDDYEEGYHDVTIVCSTSGGYTVDAAENQLAYTKVGRKVHMQGRIHVTSEDSPVGTLRLSLPFTALDLTEGSGYAWYPVFLLNHGDAGLENTAIFVDEGNAYGDLVNLTDTGGFENVDESRVDTDFYVICCFTYLTT